MDANKTNTIIIGAGPAGLAVAACVAKQNLPYIVFEQEGDIATKWRNHYDRLHLHTAARFSSLPYYKFPKYFGRYPSRQQVVRYFTDYAKHFKIEPKLKHRVQSLEKIQDEWKVSVSVNDVVETYYAKNVVVATGYNRVPNMPTWPGLDEFSGSLIHSADYKTGRAYEGQNVLVVGYGNSSGEIALDLWECGAKVDLSVRSAVNVVPKEIFGIPTLALGIVQKHLPPKIADASGALAMKLLVGDLEPYGLRKLERGPMEEIATNARVPSLDVGTVALIKNEKVKVYPGIERFFKKASADYVCFTDGRELAVDALILGTGYSPGLQDFVKDQGLLENDKPIKNGVDAADKGLYFCGFYISPAGMLREISSEAKQIASQLSAQ